MPHKSVNMFANFKAMLMFRLSRRSSQQSFMSYVATAGEESKLIEEERENTGKVCKIIFFFINFNYNFASLHM